MNKSDLFSKNELYISIENLYNQGNLPHALLFLSIDEFTNLEFSKKVAFKVACNSNEDYLKANIGTHPDILSYRPLP